MVRFELTRIFLSTALQRLSSTTPPHQQLNKVLNRSLGYLTHRKYKTGGEVWQLLFGGTKCFKDIISYLYDDFNCAIYLDRKFIKSQEFVNEINTRKRKKRVNKPKR